MERWTMRGGGRLRGVAAIHGAKNSVLPLLAATVLTGDTVCLHNCPRLSDVAATEEILRHLGCAVRREGHTLTVDTAGLDHNDIPDHLMRRMRSSVIFLGALLGRCGEADLFYPGGCDLGPRPIDLHLSALRTLGADIRAQGGRICARAPHGLHGAEITLPFPSVGATENVLLAAATADGVTVLNNAAREPEITDLCACLTACGAHIEGAGESRVCVGGVPVLSGCEHTVLPDRIEAATVLSAAAITGGAVRLTGVCPAHLTAVLSVLAVAGCRLDATPDTVSLTAPERLRAFGRVCTMPYPGFPTDAQALLMAAACTADGVSLFVENMFSDRYRHVGELVRMGAVIHTEERTAVVQGVPRLSGAPVECTDLRGGAAVVIAAAAADGETEVRGIGHIERGYEDLPALLGSLGIPIRRNKTEEQTHGTTTQNRTADTGA